MSLARPSISAGCVELLFSTWKLSKANMLSASLHRLVRDPLHVTAIGKAILAWLPTERRPVLTDWRKLTPATITIPKSSPANSFVSGGGATHLTKKKAWKGAAVSASRYYISASRSPDSAFLVRLRA